MRSSLESPIPITEHDSDLAMIHHHIFKYAGSETSSEFTPSPTSEPSWIVLVHGLTCAGSDWQEVNEILGSSNSPPINCLCVDLRGHGESSDLPEPYAMGGLANDIIELMNSLQIGSAVFAGHSMGTRVVASIASQQPDLVNGLVFVDGSRQCQGTESDARDQATRVLPTDNQLSEFIENMFDMMFVPGSDVHRKKDILNRAVNTKPEIFRKLITELFIFDAVNAEQVMSSIKCPLIVIQSTTVGSDRIRRPLQKDEATTYSDFVLKHVPHAELIVVPDTGHFTQIEEPQIVVDALYSLLNRA